MVRAWQSWCVHGGHGACMVESHGACMAVMVRAWRWSSHRGSRSASSILVETSFDLPPSPLLTLKVGLAAVLALAQAACLWACPESPIWLETHDKERADEACITL